MKLGLIAAVGGFALVAGAAGAAVLLTTGSDRAPIAPPRVAPAVSAVTPVRGAALTLARQSGRRLVALSLSRAPLRAAVTVLDAEGRGVPGLRVRVGDRSTATCGRGCYRAALRESPPAHLDVHLAEAGGAGSTVTFSLPARWPVSGLAVLRKVERAFRGARSVVYRERLESAPGRAITTIWRMAAPDRLTYSIAGGSSAVVIGAQRWDRPEGSARWLRSAQEPLDLPALPWGPRLTSVVLLDPPAGRRGKAVRLAMFEPSIPAWYEATLDARTFHLRSLLMAAPSHFMRQTFLDYGEALSIVPPSAA